MLTRALLYLLALHWFRRAVVFATEAVGAVRMDSILVLCREVS